MDKAKDYQKLVQTMEREVRALKTAQNVGASIKCYYYSYTPTAVTTLTITYASGTQPIISQVYTEGGDAVLGSVDGVEQKLYFYAQTSSEVQIVSTRPILNVG